MTSRIDKLVKMECHCCRTRLEYWYVVLPRTNMLSCPVLCLLCIPKHKSPSFLERLLWGQHVTRYIYCIGLIVPYQYACTSRGPLNQEAEGMTCKALLFVRWQTVTTIHTSILHTVNLHRGKLIVHQGLGPSGPASATNNPQTFLRTKLQEWRLFT